MKTKMKKLIVATIALLTVGSGVIIANQVNEEVNAVAKGEEAMIQGLQQPELPQVNLQSGTIVALGGTQSKVILNSNNAITALEDETAPRDLEYNYATAFHFPGMVTSMDSTKESNKAKENLRMPSIADVEKMNGGPLTSNAKVSNPDLYTWSNNTSDYWIEGDRATADTETVRPTISTDGIYNQEHTYRNKGEETECETRDEQILAGRLVNKLEIPGYSTGAYKTIASTFIQATRTNGEAITAKLTTVKGNHCTHEDTLLYCDPTYGTPSLEGDSLKIPGKTAAASSIYAVTTMQGSDETTQPGRDITVPAGKCVAVWLVGRTPWISIGVSASDLTALDCVQFPTEQTINLSTQKRNYYGDLSYYPGCSGTNYPPYQGTARTLIEADLSSVVFASNDKTVKTDQTLSEISFMNDSGPYLTATDTGLKASAVSDVSKYLEGYTVSGNAISIAKDSVTNNNGKITIPVDVTDSVYEKNGGLTSEQALVVKVKNLNDNKTYDGRLSAEKVNSNGKDIMKATFKVDDIIGTEQSGEVRSAPLEVTIYQNELISKGADATKNDKYLDFVSEPLTLDVNIGGVISIESDSSAAKLDQTSTDLWGTSNQAVVSYNEQLYPGSKIYYHFENCDGTDECKNNDNTEFTLVEGKATITNLPNGSYDLVITGTDQNNLAITRKTSLRVDTGKPSLALSNPDDLKKPTETVELTLAPTATISGIKSVALTSAVIDGQETITDPVAIEKKQPVSRAVDGVYAYTATANGDYKFKITGYNEQSTELAVSVSRLTTTPEDSIVIDPDKNDVVIVDPKDPSDTHWGKDNSIDGNFEYPDIIKPDGPDGPDTRNPNYEITNATPTDISPTKGDITINPDGSFNIPDLPDGEYDITIKIPVDLGGEDDWIKKTIHVRVEKEQIKIQIANPEVLKVPAKQVDLNIEVTIPLSGLDKVYLTKAIDPEGKPLAGYEDLETTPREITEKWSTAPLADANTKNFKFTATKAGYYFFEATAKSGAKGTLKDVTVGNVSDGTFIGEVTAQTYNAEQKMLPVDITNSDDKHGEWAANRVEILLNTTITGTMLEGITWQYLEFTPDELTSKGLVKEETFTEADWKSVANAKGDPVDQLYVEDDGIHYFRFRAVTSTQTLSYPVQGNPGDTLTANDYYIVKVDKSAPTAPTLTSDNPSITDIKQYDGTTWFNRAQNITATLTQDGGSTNTIQYRESSVSTDWSTYSGSIAVSSNGAHVIEVRSIDELDRASSIQTLRINVDTLAPTMTKMTYGANEVTGFLNNLTFGLFFKDKVDVVMEADDGDAESNKYLTYQYIKLNKDDLTGSPTGITNYSPQEDEWIDGNPASISEDWKGFVLGRVKDRAGNVSNVWYTDGIVIDQLGPKIDFGANAKADTWQDSDTLEVHVEDPLGTVSGKASGIKAVNYYTSKDSTLKALNLTDGKATITGLDEGVYTVNVEAEDTVGHITRSATQVMIDMTYPSIKVEGHDVSAKVLKEETLTLTPTVGGSGMKEITVLKDNKAYTVINTLDNGVAKLTITENGFYSFTVTSNAGETSMPVTLDVKNLSNQKPEISITATSGGAAYTTGTWTKDNVDLLINNETKDLYSLDLYYRVMKLNPTSNELEDVTPTSEPGAVTWVDESNNTWLKFKSNLSVSETGEYTYYFKAKATSGEVSTVKTIKVLIDLNEVPQVTLSNEADYVVNAWHTGVQRLRPSFTDPNAQIAKDIYYKVDGGQWIKGDDIRIADEGKHTVDFKIEDALGRVGGYKTVYVNVDNTTPTLTETVTPKDGKALIEVVPSVGLSGIKDLTIQHKDDASATDIKSTNEYEATKTGEYTIILTNNAGQEVRKVVNVTALSNTAPIVSASVTDTQDPDNVYDSGKKTWSKTGVWNEHTVKVTLSTTNAAQVGTVNYYVDQDGIGFKKIEPAADGSVSITVGDTADYQDVNYFDFKAISDSKIESEIVSVDLFIDKVAPSDFTVENTSEEANNLVFNKGNFVNTTQTLKTDFNKAGSGSEEWLTWSIADAADPTTEIATADQFIYTLEKSGRYIVTVSSKDELGRVGATKKFEVDIDKEMPTNLQASISSNSFKNFLNELTLGLFFKDDTNSLDITADWGISEHGTIHYQIVSDEKNYQRDIASSAWKTGADKASITFGEKTFNVVYFYAVDTAGNRTGVYRTDGITIDNVSPSLNVSAPNGGTSWSDKNIVEINNALDETANKKAAETNMGFKELYYQVDGTTDVQEKHPIALDANGTAQITVEDGEHTLYINGSDYAGNTLKTDGSAIEQKVMIDTSEPTLTITGHDEATIVSQENLTINAAAGASGLWELDNTGTQLDGGKFDVQVDKTVNGKKETSGFKANADPYNITENGTYTFTIMNKAGKKASETIIVNNISSDVSMMNVSMKHTVAGTETDYSEGTWSGSDVTITVQSTMNGNIQYRLNPKERWQTSADGKITVSQEGISSVGVRLVTNGAQIMESKTLDIRIDTTAPNAPIILNKDMIEANDAWYTKTQNVKASFTKDPNGCEEWMEYSLDNATWIKGDNVNVTLPGINTVYFRVSDALGNVSASDSVDIKIDLSAPTGIKVEFETSGIMNILNDLSFGLFFKDSQNVNATADFSQSGASRFEYQFVRDGDSFDPEAAWTSVSVSGDGVQTKKLRTLDEGDHGVIYVRAVDKAGNVSAIVNSKSALVDGTGPTINAQDMTSWSNSNEVVIGVSDDLSGVDKVTYTHTPKAGTESAEKAATIHNDGSVTINGLTNGEGTLKINATDKAGNTSTKSMSVMIDVNKAKITDVSSTDDLITAKVALGNLSGIKRVIIYGNSINETEMTKDDTNSDASTGIYTYKALSSGSYTVKTETNAGMIDTSTIEITSVTSEKPVLKVTPVYTQKDKAGTAYLDGEWASANIDVSVENVVTSMNVEKYYYTIYESDGKTIVQEQRQIEASDGKYIQAISMEGKHVVSFIAENSEGIQSDEVKLNVNIDRSTPEAPIVEKREQYTENDWYSVDQVIKASFTPSTSGATETLQYNVDDNWDTEHQLIWETYNNGVTIDTEGEHKVVFRVVKENGSVSPESKIAYVNIDKSAPTDLSIQIDEVTYRNVLKSITFGAFFNDTAKVTISGNFDISGVKKIEYAIVSMPEDKDIDKAIKALSDGDYETYNGSFTIDPLQNFVIVARAFDKAGNQTETIYSDELSIDNIKPAIKFLKDDGTEYTKEEAAKWTTLNHIHMEVKDMESGVKSVKAVTTQGEAYEQTAVMISENIYELSNLPDGSSYLVVTAEDNAGNTKTAYFAPNIDTKKPNFSVTRTANDGSMELKVEKKNITVGASKVASMTLTYTGADGLPYSETLKADDDGNYTFTAIENATYTFTLTNGAGVSTSKDEVVDTIKEVQKGIYVSENVKDGEWIATNNFNFDAWVQPRNINLTYTKYAYDNDTRGAQLASDNTKNMYSLNVSETGKFEYVFSYVDPTNAETITKTVLIFVDGDIPTVPTVSGAYGEDDWYSGTQRVSASNIPSVKGSSETIQYRIDGTGDYQTGKTAVIDPATLGYGKHTVEFKAVDMVDHESEPVKAYVNITNPSDFRMTLLGDFTTKTTSQRAQMQVHTGNAPLTSLTVQNLSVPESDVINISVDQTAVNKNKTYETYINENGVYEFIATDASGNKRVLKQEINNIQTTATDLSITMRNDAKEIIRSGVWSNTPVTISAKNTGDNTANNITYSMSGTDSTGGAVSKSNTKYDGSIKVSDEGTYTYTFILTPASGDPITKNVIVKVDTSKPATPEITDKANYDKWLSSSEVIVRAAPGADDATDKVSARTIRYSIDGKDFMSGSAARVYGDGEHTVIFKAVDEAGNESETTSVNVNIDRIRPVVDSIANEKDADSGKFKITMKAHDNVGLEKMYYQLVDAGGKPANNKYTELNPAYTTTNENGKNYEAVITIPNTFNGNVYVKAVDMAGNESVVKTSGDIDVDYTIPTVRVPADMNSWTYDNSIKVEVDFGASGAADTNALRWEAIDTETGNKVTDNTGKAYEGTITATGNGSYTISDLPNGTYRVYVYATNKAGNVGSNNTAVQIEHIMPVVTATKQALSADKHSQQIDIQVEYAGVNLRPDKLYVKKGTMGTYEEVSTYDKVSGTAQYTALENNDYTFKAVHSLSGNSGTSSAVSITEIEADPDAIDLSQYIRFISDDEDVCKSAGAAVDPASGTCIFDAYKNVTNSDVTLIVINWNELSEKMNAKNVRLVKSEKAGSVSSGWKDVTWGDSGDIEGSMVLDSYDALQHAGAKMSVRYALMSNSDDSISLGETITKDFTIIAGGSSVNNVNRYALQENTLRLQANKAVNVEENRRWQIVEAGRAIDENGWKSESETITLGRGNYTMMIENANGEIEEHAIHAGTTSIESEESSLRTFIKTITFGLLCDDNINLKITSELENMEVNVDGTWIPYTEGFSVSSDTKTLKLRGTNSEGAVEEEQIQIQ